MDKALTTFSSSSGFNTECCLSTRDLALFLSLAFKNNKVLLLKINAFKKKCKMGSCKWSSGQELLCKVSLFLEAKFQCQTMSWQTDYNFNKDAQLFRNLQFDSSVITIPFFKGT